MARSPVVSIVIPCHNSRETIVETVGSAVAQEDMLVEVIVVDDGSTDQSRDVVAEAGLLERVQWVRQDNQGVSAARNRGLDLSAAPYLCFLDSDDVLEPRFASEMVRLLQARQGRFGYCNYRYFADTPERPTVNIRYSVHEGFAAGPILNENFIPTPGAALVARAALGGLRFDAALQGAADWWFWMQLCMREAVHHHPDCLIHIRLRPDSMGQQKAAMIRDVVALFERAEVLMASSAIALPPRDEGRFHYRAASALVDAGRPREAMRRWIRAARRGLGVRDHLKLLGKVTLRGAGQLRQVERALWRRRVER